MRKKLRLLQLLIILTVLSSTFLVHVYANPETVTLPISRGKILSGDAGKLLIEKHGMEPTVFSTKVVRCTPPSRQFVLIKIFGGVPNEVRELLKERSASIPPKPVKFSFHIDSLKPGGVKAGVYSGYIEWEGGYRRSIVLEIIDLADVNVDAVILFDIGGTLAPDTGDEYGGYTLVRVDVIVNWQPASSGPLVVGVIDHDIDPYTVHGYMVYGGHASVSLYPPYDRYHYHTLVVGNLGSTAISYTGHVQWQTVYENEPGGADIEG